MELLLAWLSSIVFPVDILGKVPEPGELFVCTNYVIGMGVATLGFRLGFMVYTRV